MRLRIACGLVLFAALSGGADWARFRGPNGSGTAEAAGLPVAFGPSKNVAWKTPAPFGRSSPIVASGRIFLTAREGGELVTLAYDERSGRELWRRAVKPAQFSATYQANDPASATPAADGKNVYVFFPDVGLIAYSLTGKEQWRVPMGPFRNFYGMATSPVVADGMVLLLCDQLDGSFLLAVNTRDGKQRWRTARPESKEGWSVPIVYQDQVVAVGTTRVDSYHLSTGERRWWMPLNSNGSMGSPVLHGETVVVTASGSEEPWLPSFASVIAKDDKDGDGLLSKEECKEEKEWFEHFGWVDSNHDGLVSAAEWDEARRLGVGDYGAVAIPLGSKGKVESSAVRWKSKRNLPYVPSALVYEGIFYMVKTGGIITSMDAGTGAILKQGRSAKALGEYYSSPVAGDGKIFAVSEEGKVTVIRAGAEWEVLAVNELGEEAYATPAISGGRLIVRTRGMLYGFAEK